MQTPKEIGIWEDDESVNKWVFGYVFLFLFEKHISMESC